jgi:hypothetical protein
MPKEALILGRKKQETSLISRGNGDSVSISTLEGILNVNQELLIDNFDGIAGDTMPIKDDSTSGRVVTVTFEWTPSDLTLCPSQDPTSGPTADATSATTSGPPSGPTSEPIVNPTSGPTSALTEELTSDPTSAPTGDPTHVPNLTKIFTFTGNGKCKGVNGRMYNEARARQVNSADECAALCLEVDDTDLRGFSYQSHNKRCGCLYDNNSEVIATCGSAYFEFCHGGRAGTGPVTSTKRGGSLGNATAIINTNYNAESLRITPCMLRCEILRF